MGDLSNTFVAKPTPKILSSFGPANCLAAEAMVMLRNESNSTAAWPAANNAFYVSVQVGTPCTVYQIGWINGATVAGNIDVGIYDWSGTRLVSAGSTAMSGASVVQVVNTTDTLLTPGTYFLAMNASSTATLFMRTGTTNQLLQACGVYQQAVGAIALPATATFAAPSNGFCPLVFATTTAVL